MTITRNDLVQLVREYADAVGSSRWTDDLVLRITSTVADNEWSNILNAAPYYTFAKRNVVTDANGQVPLASLDHGTGDTGQYWYRILTITDQQRSYAQMEYVDAPLLANDAVWAWDIPSFYTAGEFLSIVPRTPNLALQVTVNYKPPRLNQLSNGTVVVPFPSGAEMVIAYEAAAQVLIKGGAESGAAQVLKIQANEERQMLLDDIRRRTTQPTFMAYPDRRGDWAG